MKKRNPPLAALGLNVRRRREELALTQEKLAEKAELDQTYIGGDRARFAESGHSECRQVGQGPQHVHMPTVQGGGFVKRRAFGFVDNARLTIPEG